MMVSINSSAFYSIIVGRNCFCCLCFKTVADSAVHMEDEMFLSMKEKTTSKVVVADLIIEVLGEQLYNQLSTFDAICNQCLSSAINSFKFIRKCKSNIKSLCKVIDNLSVGVKETTMGIKEGYRVAYVSIDTQRCTWNKYYSKFVSFNRTKIFSKFIDLEMAHSEYEAKKVSQMKQKELKMNLIRLDDENALLQSKIKQVSKSRGLSKTHEGNNNKICKRTSRSPQLISDHNGTHKQTRPYDKQKSKEKTPSTPPQYVCVNQFNDKVNGVCRLKTIPNILRNNINRKKLIEWPPEATKQDCQIKTLNSSVDCKTSEEQIQSSLSVLSQTSSNSLQQYSQALISDIEIELFNNDNITVCQYCGEVCNNSTEFTNHLKTHDTLMIMETIIKTECEGAVP